MMKNEGGAAAIEFVLSLPIFIVTLLSLIFYGYAFLIYKTGIDAVYVGAEAAVVESPLSADYDPLTSVVARNAARRIVANYASMNDGRESSDQNCLAPAERLLASENDDYVYTVDIDFGACRVLQKLSVDLPFLGRLPPLPQSPVKVSAVVRL